MKILFLVSVYTKWSNATNFQLRNHIFQVKCNNSYSIQINLRAIYAVHSWRTWNQPKAGYNFGQTYNSQRALAVLCDEVRTQKDPET